MQWKFYRKIKQYSFRINKKSDSGISAKDKRGHHQSTNKIPDCKTLPVLEHINSFPHYISHYSRQQNPHKKYLLENLNINEMYKQYIESCKAKNPVKGWYYRHIFKTRFNLGFHRSSTDPCSKCDKLKTKIDSLPESNAKK